MKKFFHDEAGFTLIEMMIVVAIIAILTAIAIPKFSNSLAVANTAKVRADLQTINTAAELFYNQNGKYPENIGGLDNYLDTGKITPPTGKICIEGNVQDIIENSQYSYNKDDGAKFMDKKVDAFQAKGATSTSGVVH